MDSQLRRPAQSMWSKLEKTPNLTEKLKILCHSENALRKAGYVVAPLPKSKIFTKTRCQNCGCRLKDYQHPNRDSRRVPVVQGTDTRDETSAVISTLKPRRHNCMFHDGKVVGGLWLCCGGQVRSPGCSSKLHHEPGPEEDLEQNWKYYETPKPSNHSSTAPRRQGRVRNQLINLGSNLWKDVRSAVVMDCEMGTTSTRESELIRLTMVDFFTSDVLIDQLVKPSVPMAHYNTRYSGVTASAMHAATRTRTCIYGRDAARRQVFRFVGPETIVVGHSGNHDLDVLRWIHPLIIDTYVLESYHMSQSTGRSLKALSAKKLGLEIQNAKDRNGKHLGHDSFEDTMATRELTIWWMNTIPDD